MTPVDWDRYYLFPVVFLTLLIAVGAARGPGEIRLLAARPSPAVNRLSALLALFAT
ncbi:MAG: hypothetical protein IPN03_18835 [Holophagales bacterium]|nr:hypothetical protein [Holophagales bacterium]